MKARAVARWCWKAAGTAALLVAAAVLSYLIAGGGPDPRGFYP